MSSIYGTWSRDKTRAFDLLREKGAIKALVEFSGGNDQGGVDGITIVYPGKTNDGVNATEDLEVYYDGYEHEFVNGKWQEKPKKAMTADQELSTLLQGPVDDEFGSWAGDFEAYGTLTWDVETGKCQMEKHYETRSWSESSEEW